MVNQDTVDLKKDAVDMFNAAVQAVHPKTMIHNMLKYNAATSELRVEDKVYNLSQNVYVVGLGKAVTGMARVVEDMLSQHIVKGIITIPSGVRQEMARLQLQ